ADAARYGRRPDLARRALSATRTRFSGSLHARDAAFFLGGLAESEADAASAVDWYGVYLRESQDGAYASQALGRRMILLQRMGNEAAAQQAASEYARRFGGEAYGPAAQKLLHVP
ncbi:MAG TPA: hypothetical protein VKU41_05345, partial [Polyangiaceae bacterium]|nr:hypothetical protein [Polyangiaceae bacterium]